MYILDSDTVIKLSSGSPSLLLNNLSVSASDTFAFVRLNEVYISHMSGESFKVPISKSTVYQTAFITLHGICMLAILSNQGVQVWSSTGENMVFYFPLNSLLGYEGDEDKYLRGVTATGDYLCVGCSTGNILIFEYKDRGDFPLLHNLESEKAPITVVTSSADSSSLVCCNDVGSIFSYKIDDAFLQQKFSYRGNGFPCTAACQKGEWVFAAYSSGHIRGFRLDIEEMCFEITAHSRAITGLTINTDGTEIISCSKDQYVNVWSIPDFRSAASSRVGFLFGQLLENRLCTGVVSLNDGRICVASYDDGDLAVLRKAT